VYIRAPEEKLDAAVEAIREAAGLDLSVVEIPLAPPAAAMREFRAALQATGGASSSGGNRRRGRGRGRGRSQEPLDPLAPGRDRRDAMKADDRALDDCIRAIVGRGGSVLRGLEEKHECRLNVDRGRGLLAIRG